MYLVDTNIISELSKAKPNKAVRAWFNDHKGLALSVISIQEIVYGVETAPASRKAYFQAWLDEILKEKSLTIIGFDSECARSAGWLAARNQTSGRTVSILDVQIAATALRYNLALATRNEKDFKPMAIPLVNPFDYSF